MTGCCAPNCSNRASKGFKVHQFPANKERRLQWLKNMKRPNWSPTKNSRLCDAHFEETQFELRRMDGKIKLKQNAIPTIFQHSENVSKKPRFVASKKKEDDNIASAFHDSLQSDDMQNGQNKSSLNIELCKAKNCTSYKNSQPVPLFPFPQSEVRCQVWVQRTQNEELFGVLAKELNRVARLCAEHFDESQFTDVLKETLVPDALPTIFPGHFVSLPMLEESGQSTPNLPQEQSREIQIVKNEPSWESSQVSTTSKRTPNAELRLTYQQLFSSASLVKLPSSLWGVHKCQKSEFVAFAHMPIPEPNILIDKAIVFKDSCRANVYFNGRRVLLGMGEVNTLNEIEALLEQLNNLTTPRSPSSTSSEET